MSNTLIATLGGISALFGWGISDYLAAKASRKFSGFETNAAIQLAGLIIAPFLLFLTGQHVPSLGHIAIIIAASLCFTSAYLLFIKALSTGAVGIVVPLANSFPLITLLLTVIFLSTVFSRFQVTSMIVIIAGAVLLSIEKRQKGKSFKELHKETLLAFFAAMAWGLGFFIINTIVNNETWQIIAGVLSLTMGIISLLLIMFSKSGSKSAMIKGIPKNKIGVIAGFILTMSTVGFYVAGHRTGSILIPAVIGSGGPLITSMIAAIVDEERINFSRRLGAVILVGGIIMLNAAS